MTLNTLIDLGIMIFAGMFCGRMAKHLHLPNVTGYLVAGLLIGPNLTHLIFGADAFCLLSEDFLESISIVSDVALGFIAFSIGNEFKMSYFKRVGAAPIVIACLESLFAVLFVVVGLLISGQEVAFSIVLAAIAAATAPAATIMVIKQYRAKGPVTESLLSVVAIDDATALILFSLSVAVAQAISNSSASLAASLLSPLREIGGALVVGAVMGFIFLIPLRFFKKQGNRLSLIVGFIFAGLGIAKLLGLSNLLLCMAMGAVIANFSPDVGKLMDICDSVTPPIFMLFFVASGADLRLDVLPTVGVIGAIYIILRVVGKIIGAGFGAALSKCDRTVKKYLGPCLLPQAGVAIGLSLAAGQVVPEYAPQIRAVILCGTLIYELIGPAVTKFSLKKAGEITE
ncbi:MAG: cation/H(+) antiporter [Clostridiales bacterium]|nr:cation/H(+) antiporter [Clostridiales bacterium]